MALDSAVKVKAPALYARVSSEDQVSGTSLDDQVDKCLKQAAVYGWEIPIERVFIDDGYTGSNLDRPAMNRLREAVKVGEVDCVMVMKLDRLSRNIRDTVNLVLEEWTKTYKVVFRSVTEDFNTNSPLGTLIFSILASFAHFERDVIRDRTENGRRRRFSQGRRAAGDAPFGYVMGEVPGTMVINPPQAQLVQRIFKSYLSGKGFMKIATELNDNGYRTTKGNVWTDKVVRDILINGVYTGKVKYSGEYGGGHHEPIIDEATYTAANDLRIARAKVGGRSIGTPFLLAGLMYCKGCGQMMYTQPGTESKRKRKNGTVHLTYNHPYYQCGGRLKKGTKFCSCGYVQQDVLEEYVVQRLTERFGQRVSDAQTVAVLAAEMDSHLSEVGRDLEAVEKTIQEKHQAILRWETAFERGELNADRFGSRVERLEAEIGELETKRDELGQILSKLRESQVNVDWLHRVAGQLDSWAVLEPASRKQLVHYLIDHIRVWKDSQGRGNHKEETPVEVDVVWNRSEQALPEGDVYEGDGRTELRDVTGL